MHRTFLAVVVVLAALSAGFAAPAASRDHDDARRAVSRGEALPLSEIMNKIPPRYQGKLLNARLKKRGQKSSWIYQLQILTGQGKVTELVVDAKSGRVLQVRK
jgi:uncharacterized membrane protein YkoI